MGSGGEVGLSFWGVLLLVCCILHVSQTISFSPSPFPSPPLFSLLCSPPQEASSGGFRKIAKFIFGGNTKSEGGAGSESVAMTSPVRQELMVRGGRG